MTGKAGLWMLETPFCLSDAGSPGWELDLASTWVSTESPLRWTPPGQLFLALDQEVAPVAPVVSVAGAAFGHRHGW